MDDSKPIRLLKANEIECRVGTVREKGLSLLLYKDERADMKILDETYGTLGWQRRHELIGGSLYCTVSVWDESKQQWISKSDVGTESYTEKEKGQASDSFKRACVSLGIGRELYTAPFIWISSQNADIRSKDGKYYTYDKFSVRQITYNGEREIAGLVIAKEGGRIVYEYGKCTKQQKGGFDMPETDVPPHGAQKAPQETETSRKQEERMTVISKELERTGVALDAVLKRYGVSSVSEMSDTIFSRAMGGLRRTKTKVA